MHMKFLNRLIKCRIYLYIYFSFQSQFWRSPDSVNRHVDIWLPQKSTRMLENILNKVNLTIETIISKNDSSVDGFKNITMKNLEIFDKRYNSLQEVSWTDIFFAWVKNFLIYFPIIAVGNTF